MQKCNGNSAATSAIQEDWEENPRWRDIRRDHTPADVCRLRGTMMIEHTLAHRGAEKLWRLLTTHAVTTVDEALQIAGEALVDPEGEGLKGVDAHLTRNAISRARILIVSRDRGGGGDDDGPPPSEGSSNDDWLREALGRMLPRLQTR